MLLENGADIDAVDTVSGMEERKVEEKGRWTADAAWRAAHEKRVE
jgi:hypothetical protein